MLIAKESNVIINYIYNFWELGDLQFLSALLFLAIVVFVIYYLPLISKDLHKITKQNEEIKILLEKISNKVNDK